MISNVAHQLSISFVFIFAASTANCPSSYFSITSPGHFLSKFSGCWNESAQSTMNVNLGTVDVSSDLVSAVMTCLTRAQNANCTILGLQTDNQCVCGYDLYSVEEYQYHSYKNCTYTTTQYGKLWRGDGYVLAVYSVCELCSGCPYGKSNVSGCVGSIDTVCDYPYSASIMEPAAPSHNLTVAPTQSSSTLSPIVHSLLPSKAPSYHPPTLAPTKFLTVIPTPPTKSLCPVGQYAINNARTLLKTFTGCWTDQNNPPAYPRSLPISLGTVSFDSKDYNGMVTAAMECALAAQVANCTILGLQAGNQCFCGTDLKRSQEYYPNTQNKCASYSTQYGKLWWGGSFVNAQYSVCAVCSNCPAGQAMISGCLGFSDTTCLSSNLIPSIIPTIQLTLSPSSPNSRPREIPFSHQPSQVPTAASTNPSIGSAADNTDASKANNSVTIGVVGVIFFVLFCCYVFLIGSRKRLPIGTTSSTRLPNDSEGTTLLNNDDSGSGSAMSRSSTEDQTERLQLEQIRQLSCQTSQSHSFRDRHDTTGINLSSFKTPQTTKEKRLRSFKSRLISTVEEVDAISFNGENKITFNSNRIDPTIR